MSYHWSHFLSDFDVTIYNNLAQFERQNRIIHSMLYALIENFRASIQESYEKKITILIETTQSEGNVYLKLIQKKFNNMNLKYFQFT